ncbi:protein ENDO16-like [Salvia hispanica]|uniref:protein ENDO16-like n=1 Tax=Salvia hispanica TaxID=49212 RepID=UPI002009C972|nr:protein ENDO16-like [Salvia hispanica]
MDPTQATRNSQSEAYDAVLLAELTQKLGSVEKAKKVYAPFSASLMTSAAAIPPPTIPADSTAQHAVLHDEGPQDSTRVPDGFQQAETASLEADKEEATNELIADGGLSDGDKKVEFEGQGSENPNSEVEKEGETPIREEGEGETPVMVEFVEGETPVVERIAEGETPVLEMTAEGETPMETGDETPKDFRGSTPEPMEEGETPVYIKGGTPMVDDVGETSGKLSEMTDPDITGVPAPVEEGQDLIVDLVDDQEEDEPKVDERAKRRMARRSLLDEVDDLVYSETEEFPARGIEAEEAEDRRLAKERARKGKAAATQSKRSRKAPSPVTEVPSTEEQAEPTPGPNSELGESDEEFIHERVFKRK